MGRFVPPHPQEDVVEEVEDDVHEVKEDIMDRSCDDDVDDDERLIWLPYLPRVSIHPLFLLLLFGVLLRNTFLIVPTNRPFNIDDDGDDEVWIFSLFI